MTKQSTIPIHKFLVEVKTWVGRRNAYQSLVQAINSNRPYCSFKVRRNWPGWVKKR